MPPSTPRPPEANKTDLLSVIDALVRDGDGAAGFVGHVAIGIRGADGDRWWCGKFGGTTEFGFVDVPSREADAIFLMSEADAQALIMSGVFPESPELSLLCGEPRTMQRFLRRYAFAPKSVLGVRCRSSE